MNLRLIENKDIDLFKWDSCVLKSLNGLPYAYSWYLNIISDNWKGIVMDNYDAVMPVLEERFLSVIPYVRKDVLVPQLGIFTKKLLSNQMQDEFFDLLLKYYASIKIPLNKYSITSVPAFNNKKVEKYELDLIKPYKRLCDNYSSDLNRKIMNAEEHKITVVKGLMPNDLVKLVNRKHFAVNRSFAISLRILTSTSIRYRIGQIYGAYTEHNNICAAILFLKSNKKAIMLVTAFTNDALNNNAIECIVDHYLKAHAENDLTFVFENVGHRKPVVNGPDFGAKKISYQTIFKKGIVG